MSSNSTCSSAVSATMVSKNACRPSRMVVRMSPPNRNVAAEPDCLEGRDRLCLDDVGDELLHHLVAAGEGVVEAREGHAGLGHDGAGGRALYALLGDHAQRGLHDLAAAVDGGHARHSRLPPTGSSVPVV
jgi:hypothetical protein